MQQPSAPYRRHRFPGEIISHAGWLYYRFLLSFRDVEEREDDRVSDVIGRPTRIHRHNVVRQAPAAQHQDAPDVAGSITGAREIGDVEGFLWATNGKLFGCA